MTSLMLVIALDGKPGVYPILLALGVIPHVHVPKRRQFTGDRF